MNKKSPEQDLELKTSGRGFKLCQQLTSAQAFKKLETVNVQTFGGRGKQLGFNTVDNKIISGRGFRKTTNSESEDDFQKPVGRETPEDFVNKSSGRDLILSKISSNENIGKPIKSEFGSDRDSPKTTVRGNLKRILAKLKKSDTECDTSIDQSFQSTK